MMTGVLRIQAIGVEGTIAITIIDGLPAHGATIPPGLNIDLSKSDGAGIGLSWTFEEVSAKGSKGPHVSRILR